MLAAEKGCQRPASKGFGADAYVGQLGVKTTTSYVAAGPTHDEEHAATPKREGWESIKNRKEDGGAKQIQGGNCLTSTQLRSAITLVDRTGGSFLQPVNQQVGAPSGALPL